MLESAKIDIVIVNWNAGIQLSDCVESCVKYRGDFVGSIIVVDNGSSDGSDSLIEAIDGVELIRAGENLGFGKACNLGASKCQEPLILFLNPDAAIYANTLLPLRKFMTAPSSQSVGICGIQLHDESGKVARSCSRFPSVMGLVLHSFGLGSILRVRSGAMVEWDHLCTRDVDQVIGAFFCVKRSLFNKLKGFDERFFVYFEEVDFSRRAHVDGWRTVYLADAQAYHLGGGTSSKVKAKRLFYSLRSRLIYSKKHFSYLGVFCVALSTLLIEPVSRAGLSIFRFSLQGLKETALGYGLLYGWIIKSFRKMN